MLNKLSELIQNKRIVILGFGMEGQSSFRFLSKHFPKQRFLIADQNPTIDEHPLLRTSNIDVSQKSKKRKMPQKHQDTKLHKILILGNFLLVMFGALELWWQKIINKNELKLEISCGKKYLDAISKNDFVIKSPGIKLPKDCKLESNDIFSQTDLFIQAFQKQIIGITGTKGKSTTSTLLLKILTDQNKKAILIGNIGKPAFDYWEKIEDETFIVFELSAHQLEYTRFSPSYSILLNLFPEHLDYFKTEENYFKAKLNIAKFQSENDCFFLGDSANEKIIFQNIRKKPYQSAYRLKNNCLQKINSSKELLHTDEMLYLKGLHQLKNCIPLLDLAQNLELDEEMTLQSIKTFKPLPHRIEFIGNIKNISFYNDSISTIPEASIEALKALSKVNYLILGGLDRILNYQKLYDFLQEYPLEKVFFIGPAGKRMVDELPFESKFQKVYIEKLLYFEEYLVDLIKQNEDAICLLSPAAASYDEFKDFEDRGDFFRSLVGKFM
ncbi:MAG: UDP-N-acetylmuramoyl-L-alanine--D-glutamate ligase [Bacteroidales bacterium]|jgi:UDP-N-acetylmuramoylalanine--D-glutamate ligase|nr:UDP-N-acetylmuramoyl-L-alanine--D-glutamate ligase [Bacteroidales bacterium]